VELSYGRNARRFTTGREATQSQAALFAPCGCGDNSIRWNRATGAVISHAHDERVNDRKAVIAGIVLDNEFSRESGVRCPLPLKKDGIWYVQSLCVYPI